MKTLKSLLILSTTLLSLPGWSATYVQGVETTIKQVDTYHYGSAAGDIRVLTNKVIEGCESGYYLTKDDSGIDKALSNALSAFHSGATVIIQWAGSSSASYCKIHAITIKK